MSVSHLLRYLLMLALSHAAQLTASTIEEDLAAPPVPYGSKIQRTMRLLATSTPEHRHKVRILFYGQSTVSAWTQIVDKELRARFPNADIVTENLAIGGFTAPHLVDTCESDLYPWYPDLLIFCDYEASKPAFEKMCADIRSRTTADVLILTYHLAKELTWEPAHDKDAAAVRRLADKYGFELVDIRASWANHLKKNNLLTGDFQRDSIHLNEAGEEIYAKIVLPHFQYLPDQPADAAPRMTNYGADGRPLKGSVDDTPGAVLKRPLKMEFTGNRVEVAALPVAGKPGTARILIDGRKPSAFTGVYASTRPSKGLGMWMPALRRVELGPAQPRAENWTLTITKCKEDASDFNYELRGSRTGPDGKGSSKTKFVSNSKRITIDPAWFHLATIHRIKKEPLTKGFTIQWSVREMFLDEWKPQPITDKTKEDRHLLAQGLPDGKHVLEIIPNGNGEVGVRFIEIRSPNP